MPSDSSSQGNSTPLGRGHTGSQIAHHSAPPGRYHSGSQSPGFQRCDTLARSQTSKNALRVLFTGQAHISAGRLCRKLFPAGGQSIG
ncbi:hypothetical protein N7449_000263 [Penicillium cf. viridicatum]|uniref:Uncharacterized protein n=1 Tax=Penicillium cf. viridicatum TaxID=2972119 RepID=A0A9W9T8D3_9EURO|nr:hypothetical protein N7449_000263 [Penicillium cf. viridicatum]